MAQNPPQCTVCGAPATRMVFRGRYPTAPRCENHVDGPVFAS